jgi:hypothetical protein
MRTKSEKKIKKILRDKIKKKSQENDKKNQ